MNIALLVSSMEAGGAERVAATLANAWVARGDRVLLVPTYSGRGGCAYALADGVETQYLADLVTPGRGAVRRWQRLLALRRLLRERRPDVVLAFLGMVGVAAIVATRGLGLPLIVAERIDPAADRDSGRGMHWLRRWLYPLADAVVLQTDDARQSAAGMWPRVKRLQVVPNPLPPELAGRSPADHAPPARVKVVVA